MTVAPELDALVRACFANPKANLPRLVLADYLDEQGENDRATILRIQCELPAPGEGEKPKIKRGMAKPLAEAVERLGTPLALLRRAKLGLRFVRGFLTVQFRATNLRTMPKTVAQLTDLCTAGWVELLEFGRNSVYRVPEAVFAAARHVGVVDSSRTWMHETVVLKLAAEARPGAADSRLRAITAHPNNLEQVARLVRTTGAESPAPTPPPAAPTPAPVGYQHRQFFGLTPESAQLLARSGTLDGGDTIHLGGTFGAEGIRALAESPAMRRTLAVYLSADDPPEVLRPLWRIENPNLQTLALFGPLGNAGVRDLCAGTFLPQRVLDLSRTELTGASVAALIGCARLASLADLNLSRNAVGDDGIAVVLRSPTFAQLSNFSAYDCDTTPDAVLAAMFAAPARPRLRVAVDGVNCHLNRPDGRAAELWLGGQGRRTGLTFPGTCPEPLSDFRMGPVSRGPATLARLAVWLSGRTVPSFWLSYCGLRTADGPAVLRLVEQLKPETLGLNGNKFGVKWCQALAASPALAGVKRLELRNNPLTMAGVRALAASPHRRALEDLEIEGVGLKPAERKAARKLFRRVRVRC